VSLRDVIARFDPSVLLVRMKDQRQMRKAEKKLEALSDGLDAFVVEPTPELLQATVDRLKENDLPDRRVAKQMAMGGLPELFELNNGQHWVKRFIELVHDASSSVLTRCLLIGYLRTATENDSLSTLLRNYLKKNENRLPRQWQLRIARHDLLGTKVGAHVARQIIDATDQSPREIMLDAGLRGILETSAFSENIFFEICQQLSFGHTDESLARFLEWVRPNGDKHVLFSKSLNRYAVALLTPYLDTTPDDAHKLAIQGFLVDVFNDPRIHRAAWRVVPETLRNVLNRWLTEQSFELLMQIVNSSNDTTQWQERQQFWMPYIAAGHISEAWVVLGSKGAAVARQLVRRGELKSAAVYGLLQSGDVNSLHSMILLRIGDWVISEWTHLGKLRFYNQLTNKKTPKFYQDIYHASVIRVDSATDEFFTHHVGWQSQVRQYLTRKIGVDVSAPTAVTKLAKARKGGEACVSCGKLWPAIMLDVRGKCRRCNDIGFKTR